MIDIAYCDNAEFYKSFRVTRAGHIFAHPGREINRPTGRDDYLLFFVAAGSESFFLGGEKIVASAGSFIVFAPGESQRHVCENEGTSEFYYVHFECERDTFLSVFGGETSVVYRCNATQSLSEHFEDILAELQLEQSYCHEIAVTRLLEIFLRIKRELNESKGQLSSLQLKQVHKIIHTINTTWREAHSLESYAREFCLSKYHFSHLFKKYTGISPIAYRNRLRLRYAKGMLEKTDMSVAEIAENVGFATQQYFCEAFKESFLVSPSEYRKQYFDSSKKVE